MSTSIDFNTLGPDEVRFVLKYLWPEGRVDGDDDDEEYQAAYPPLFIVPRTNDADDDDDIDPAIEIRLKQGFPWIDRTKDAEEEGKGLDDLFRSNFTASDIREAARALQCHQQDEKENENPRPKRGGFIFRDYELDEKPNAPVILCDRSMAAELARRPFGDAFAVVGMKCKQSLIEEVDFTPFLGRDVIIWPTAGFGGNEYAKALKEKLPNARVLRVDDLEPGQHADNMYIRDPDDWFAARLPPRSPSSFNIINPRSLEGKVTPDREWIVADWIPVGVATGLYADGGVGKTRLLQQLQTALDIDSLWCGRRVAQGPSFGLYCEDDDDELARREKLILDNANKSFTDLDLMRWSSGITRDNTLVQFSSSGEMCTTTAWDHLVEAVLDLKVRLLVLDTAADVFGGNENDRQQVRRFIALLTKLAIDIKGAVVVTAHPSRDGLRTGNLDGGNTAWNNSFRSRLTLDFVADAPDTRLLKRKKSNYAPVGEEIRLQWHNGLLLPEGTIAGSSPISQATQAKLAEVVFLDLLDRCTVSNIYVSHLSRASNYAPKLFADCPDRQGLTKRHFEPAMQSLFAQKKIHVVDYGRKSDARQRIDRAPQYAGEPTERTP